MANALRKSLVPSAAPEPRAAAEESLSRALVDLLLRPTVYPDRPTKVELIETHISWVFLTDRSVYKLKKPVHFDFLDFSTVDARLRACQAECELNQRLAPHVYLGVLPVTIDRKGKVGIGGVGKTIDWLVKMQRLPAERMLDELIRSGQLTDAETDRLSNWLADYYHGLSPIVTDADGYRAAIERHVRNNRRELLSPVHELSSEMVNRCHAAQLQFLLLEHALFEARVCDGRIVDGHGDLRPEHVCLDGQPMVFDCIEFNDELRRIDVADELSFLAMECEYLAAERVGQRIIEAYRQRSHDHFSAGLTNFYKCYRACVRAKVAALADAQNPPVPPVPRRSLAYLELADRYGAHLGSPTVIVVCGLMGSGKTTLATSLADRLGIELLSTDFVRRELLGPSITTAAFDDGHYSPELRQRVYNELLHLAEMVLRKRMSVVLDGAFLTSMQRQAAITLAREGGAIPLVVHCDCPADVAIQRINQRAAVGPTLSEARSELYAGQQKCEEPFDGVDVVNLDTTTGLQLQESHVLSALGGEIQRHR